MATVGSIETSATAGVPSAQRRSERSLVSRLFLLLIVFIAVPIALYQTFRESERERQALIEEAVQEQGRLVGVALRPLLEQHDPSPLLTIADELERFAGPSIRIKVLFRPRAEQDARGFYYVAASPVVSTDSLQRERDELLRQGILDKVASSCAGNMILASRYRDPAGRDEVLTSITPTQSLTGCWIVVISHPIESLVGSTIAEPVWMRFEVRAAAIIYIAMAGLTLLLFLSIRRSVLRFRALARDLRTGKAGGRSFASQNELVELAGVAEEFDRLIQTLRASSESVRHAAEDNAHAMKTPIAIMRQSLEPLRRIVPATETRGRRAIDVLETSIERLDQLVSTARRMDQAMAELMDPPRQRVDLTGLMRRMMTAYASVAEANGLRLTSTLDDKVVVMASEDLLETVVENIVDNAISVSPDGGAIIVTLARQPGGVQLTISDDGPGVPPEDLERIFERRFTSRPQSPAGADGQGSPASTIHAGIGLWIVRRNIEAIGGRVRAENRTPTGLAMRIDIPTAA